MQWPEGAYSLTPQKCTRMKICENKINYEMIFVSLAKIGIKFFNFSFASLSRHVRYAVAERGGNVKMNADMFVNA